MKIDKKYEIEKAVSKDLARRVLGYVKIDEKEKCLVATDGRILAKIPVEIEKDDIIDTGAIPPKVLVESRKASKAWSYSVLKLGKSFDLLGGLSMARPTADEAGQYPSYEILLNKKQDTHHTVTLDAAKLLQLASALGSGIVTLTFAKDPLEQIRVTAGKAVGLLMPTRG